MRFSLICIFVLFPIIALAQEWSDLAHIQVGFLEECQGLGHFNPTYCERESLLYFDCFCRPDVSVGGIIFLSRLDSTGHWSDAIALPTPINIPGYVSIMPDISITGDTMFFCSNRPGTAGGMDIWMSVRENGIWLEPLNLGDSVNTTYHEFAPDYASGSSLLFFDRSDVTGYYSSIYVSENLSGSNWSLATELPEIINIPGNTTYGPSYDDNFHALYYSSSILWQDIVNIVRSNYILGEWSQPVALSDSVNDYYGHEPNSCHRVTTENADIAGDKLFCNKQVWDWNCWDFYSFLMYSVQLPNAVVDEHNERAQEAIRIYPNPSNGSFVFQVGSNIGASSINIYNICGQSVETFNARGNSEIVWKGGNTQAKAVSSGVYFVVLSTSSETYVRKILLLK